MSSVGVWESNSVGRGRREGLKSFPKTFLGVMDMFIVFVLMLVSLASTN